VVDEVGGVDVEKDVLFGVNVKAKSDKLPIVMVCGRQILIGSNRLWD
jgi:hypothetical protein